MFLRAVRGNATPVTSRHFDAVEAQLGQFIGEFFMGTTADEFEASVVAETDRLVAEFPGRAFRFVIPGSAHTLAMGVDAIPTGLQGSFLGLVGSANVGFVGPDVNSDELSTWTLGGMNESGVAKDGTPWTAYAWLRAVIEEPASAPDILQIQ